MVWDYVNQFAEFNRYTNTPVANYNGEIYNLPFNFIVIIQILVFVIKEISLGLDGDVGMI